MSINKVIIIGFCGRDPENRYMPSGEQVTSIAVATTDRWRDKATGEQKEATEWHRCVFFGKLAEIAGQYLKKGVQVYIEGKLRTQKYTDKDGIERYQTQIIVNQMQMLGSKQDSDQSGNNGRNGYLEEKQTGKRPAPLPAQSDMDDDIPF